MSDPDVRNVRAIAGSELVEAYEEAVLGMARRESGDPSMTLEEADQWYNAQRVASGAGPSRLSSATAPTTTA